MNLQNDYVLAKLYDAGGELKERWYVYYKVKDSEGNLVPRHKKAGINRFKTAKERRSFAKLIIDQVNQMLIAGERKGVIREDFYWWFEQRLKYSKEMHGFYNYRKLLSVYNKLKEFAPTLSINDITASFLKKYQIHLKVKHGNTPNTIADNMMRISIVMREIENDGQAEHRDNPFHKLKFPTERVVKNRLNENELIDLAKFDFKKKPLNQLARDMYLLSYYCAGIRFGDLARLKSEMFKNSRLIYSMHKTDKKKKERNIILVPQAQKIVNTYIGGEYLFPLKIDWDNEEQSINNENARMNKHLKKACKLAEVPEMTFHTSRNTFADIAVKKNVGTRALKEMIGHSSERITEVYMRDFYPEETDKAMRSIFKK